MQIRHSDPEFTGTEVVDTVEYTFTDGVATIDADELRADRAVALHQIGWGVGEVEPDADPVSVDAAPSRATKPREIADPVSPEDMEKPEPEIGSA